MSAVSKETRFSIKHMVCPRCIQTVERLAQEVGLRPCSVVLGELRLAAPAGKEAMAELRAKL